jgi:Asp-tRNA(Asn)/Glu-tRNA(Gln) amidotransferase A subunit family amidase
VLMGYDESDESTRPLPPPPLRRVLSETRPVPPRLAFVKGPTWDQAEPATREAFAELVEILGERILEVELPAAFARTIAVHRTIWTAELAHHLADRWQRGADRLSPQLRELIEDGMAATALAYQEALAWRIEYRRILEAILHDHDAIVTPAAPGEAPLGLQATGSPAFCSLWTLTGLPALSLPILQGPHGLPLGCQLVTGTGDDARLLRLARWLENALAEPA